MIPNELIDQILDKIDIVDVVSGYISLKKAGQNFKACCPFHEEKTPSFIVSPSRQIYHCFGCNAGGNAIGFLMRHERMDFIEAIKLLASKAGVTLPCQTSEGRAANSLAERLFAVNNMACDFYQQNLSQECGRQARRYFADRGISEQTIRQFRLGFAQDSWQSLINHSNEKGVERELMEKSGLMAQNNETKNWYDRFRNRVTFPIFDLRGKVLGFGARAMDNSLPKYINSPETMIYTKGRHLYGLNLSKEFIKKNDYVIMVEGYFDLIIPYQSGMCNIVATLGTALTTEQIDILRRFTKNVIMVYDPDKAGEEATLRGMELLIERDMNVRMAVLPKGKDPDSFVRESGKDGFLAVLKSSKDLFDYKLGTLTAKFRKDEPRGKARIAEGMLPTIAKIKNDVLKAGYLKKIAEELSVSEDSIRAELKKVVPEYLRSYVPQEKTAQKETASLAERTLLAMILENTELIDRVEKELGIERFRDKNIAFILKKISEYFKNGKRVSPSHLMSYSPDGEIGRIISEAVNIPPTIKDKTRVLNDCLDHIRKSSLRAELDDIQLRIREAESASDTEMVNGLIKKYKELIQALASKKETYSMTDNGV